MRSPSPKGGGLLTFHYSLFTFHSSLRSTTPSTARREPPKLGKLTSGNPKARSPSPKGGGLFFLDSPPGRSLWKEFFSPITLSFSKEALAPVFPFREAVNFLRNSFFRVRVHANCMYACMYVCLFYYNLYYNDNRKSKFKGFRRQICDLQTNFEKKFVDFCCNDIVPKIL